jgi:uncharacterized integral membrane protein (TIGR00698 family)
MIHHLALGLSALVCLWPKVTSGEALLAGVFIALTLGNPATERVRRWTSPLLSVSIVGLGAGMNLITVARVGLHGLGYTVLSISGAIVLGVSLGRWLRTDRTLSWLITVGTAICGGSAIAAVAPVLNARPHQTTVALGIVFMLNALALVTFPFLGHALGLTEEQFGLWGALAIHDTSSVVGATMQYGPRALEIGTTVKLARALWIVPLTVGMGALGAGAESPPANSPAPKPKRPWFILGFVGVAAMVTWFPALATMGSWVDFAAKRLLVLTLFLIGSTLTRETIGRVGVRPLLQGLILWIVMAVATLGVVLR